MFTDKIGKIIEEIELDDTDIDKIYRAVERYIVDSETETIVISELGVMDDKRRLAEILSENGTVSNILEKLRKAITENGDVKDIIYDILLKKLCG